MRGDQPVERRSDRPGGGQAVTAQAPRREPLTFRQLQTRCDGIANWKL